MSEKPKPISAKVRAAIDAMVADTAKTITDAAAVAGISREHLSRELSKPHVAEHMRQKIKRTLVVGAARAGATKLALLDSSNEMVRDRASSYVLGLIGVVPEAAASAAPSGIASPGVVIQIITHDPRPPMIDVTPAQIEIIRP